MDRLEIPPRCSSPVALTSALQQAPTDVVLSELRASSAWEAGPDVWQAALTRWLHDQDSGWLKLPLTYRQRVLKRIIAEITLDDAEVDAELLDEYLQPTADGEVGWSVRTYTLGAADAPLRLRVKDSFGGGSETGGCVWDAGLALSAYLLRGEEHRRLGAVLELGAGPGLPGLALASAGRARKVILTDHPDFPAVLDNLRVNVAALPAAAAARVHVEALDWCANAHANAARHAALELILAADVVYEPQLAEPLLRTLSALLARHSAAVVLLAAERRGEAWRFFEAQLRARLGAGELRCTDRSAEARAAMRAAECPFWCADDSIERLVLLELRSSTSAAAAAAAAAGASSSSAPPSVWRVHAAVKARLPSDCARDFAVEVSGAPSCGGGGERLLEPLRIRLTRHSAVSAATGGDGGASSVDHTCHIASVCHSTEVHVGSCSHDAIT